MSRNQVNKLYPVLYLLNTLYTLYMFYEFKGIKPVVHETAFVHPQAVVTGNVIIGKDCYIGPGAALRGDWGRSSLKMVVMYRRIAPFICFRE